MGVWRVVGGVFVVGPSGASAIYMALLRMLVVQYAWLKCVLTGVIVNALMFVRFEVWFKVPLFKGQLDPLAFLGY